MVKESSRSARQLKQLDNQSIEASTHRLQSWKLLNFSSKITLTAVTVQSPIAPIWEIEKHLMKYIDFIDTTL